MIDYCDYMSRIVPTDDNPCTPLNRAYPRYENIDFTAPELSFDGMSVKSRGLKVASIETLYGWEDSQPCDYPPIDYDTNPCTGDHFVSVECSGPELRGGFFYPENLSKCWTHDGDMLSTMWTNTQPCDIE